MLIVVSTLALAIITVVPVELPNYAAVTPDLVLIAVYHWSLYRPKCLPYLAVFAIGLIADLLSGGPLGLMPLALLLTRWAILANRRLFVGRSFPFLWLGFMVLAVTTAAAQWALASLLVMTPLELRSAAFSSVLTVAFYPVMTLVFARLQRLRIGVG